ncbi:two-component system chemotaxis response regulator CheB [Hydrogenispora ethanolica]|jgi:two-component system chemotaxis response regulator CheB|uniref:Protein-glutamate methylesterase/protein-glutamine glutaminase n=1 Tax=Hydrogenispora ethanolica TaxID=1082276 RepID=A0A4R1RFL2_HYDET|nr:chemotaxis response regulator protein-glutamate methylesterase [Hydrogenispora ethanolica]TCL64768.1 two-component system chemotaxis response regulator CheB [Hydrogenispora ethanolica]
MAGKIKVLIVDDSAMVRKVFSTELAKDPELEIVGTAPDPFIARDKIVQLNPDVLLLDIEMPKMDGLTFLEKLMRYHPMPVIIVSSLAEKGGQVALRALDLGAAEVIAKPGSSYSVQDMSAQLIDKIKAVAGLRKFSISATQFNRSEAVSQKYQFNNALLKTTFKILAIGASTGGTEALKALLTQLPADMHPILIVQHMPEFFTKAFADRLDSQCRIRVKEAEDQEPVTPGKALIAPGNKHLVLKRSGANYYVEVKDGPLVFHQRPSVEVLFQSVAKYAGANAVGTILTGMGKDGATGLLAMKKAGAYTIAQDEASSVVYGMPKEAAVIGAVSRILPLSEIPHALVEACNR